MTVHPGKVTPTEIKKIGKRSLVITWEDGHVSRYDFRHLRRNCPCAGCIDEWTNEKRIIDENIPLDLEGIAVDPVGGYALNFTFSDGHNTGIYHFSHLRDICPCCAEAKPGLNARRV